MKFIKVKYEKGSLGKNEGCKKAPDILFEKKFGEKVEEVKVNNVDVDETMNNISEVDGDFFLGGDHSITYGSFKGFCRKFRNPGIVIFDAHPDLEVNAGSATHEDYLRKLIEDGFLKKENAILVGIRKLSKNEGEFAKGMKIYYMDQIFRNEEDICDSIMEIAKEFDGSYLSIDIDVLDPVFAPGTGYLEVGGMDLNQLLYFLRRIKKMRNLKRVDLVEINPDKDINGLTVGAGKKIIEVFWDS